MIENKKLMLYIKNGLIINKILAVKIIKLILLSFKSNFLFIKDKIINKKHLNKDSVKLV